MWVKTRRANKKRKEDKQLCTVPEWYLLNGNPQRLKVTNMNKSKVTVFKKLRKKNKHRLNYPFQLLNRRFGLRDICSKQKWIKRLHSLQTKLTKKNLQGMKIADIALH